FFPGELQGALTADVARGLPVGPAGALEGLPAAVPGQNVGHEGPRQGREAHGVEGEVAQGHRSFLRRRPANASMALFPKYAPITNPKTQAMVSRSGPAESGVLP